MSMMVTPLAAGVVIMTMPFAQGGGKGGRVMADERLAELMNH
jgi:hypothetical protein